MPPKIASERRRLRPRWARAAGSIWWDRKIPLGKSYDEVIEKALAQAKCVIVLWSAPSVASEWVRNEASEGRRREILVPVFLDAVDAPLAFALVERRENLDRMAAECRESGIRQARRARHGAARAERSRRDTRVGCREQPQRRTKRRKNMSRSFLIFAWFEADWVRYFVAVLAVAYVLKTRQPEPSNRSPKICNLIISPIRLPAPRSGRHRRAVRISKKVSKTCARPRGAHSVRNSQSKALRLWARCLLAPWLWKWKAGGRWRGRECMWVMSWSRLPVGRLPARTICARLFSRSARAKRRAPTGAAATSRRLRSNAQSAKPNSFRILSRIIPTGMKSGKLRRAEIRREAKKARR